MFNVIEAIVRLALSLVGSFKPANQSADRVLVSISLNVKQTRNNGVLKSSYKLTDLKFE